MSLDFSGATTDRVTLNTSAALNSLGAITILAWEFHASSPGGNVFLISKATNSTTWELRLRLGSDDALDFLVDGSTTPVSIVPSTTLPTGQWNFVAVTAQFGTSANMYFGTLNSLATEVSYTTQDVGSGSVANNGYNLQVGNHVGQNSAFPGDIAIVAWFNTVLTLNQIRANQFRILPSNSLKLHYNLGDTGGTQPDYSGNGHSGTVSGASISDHAPLPAPFQMSSPTSPYIVSAGTIIPQVMGHRRMQGIV